MLMTVRKDDSSDVARTCSVMVCRSAEQTTDCSVHITVVHRRWSCTGRLTSTFLAARHIQSMQITVEDVLEHSPLMCLVPVHRQVQHHRYISTQGPRSWKWSAAAAPEASGDCVGLEWWRHATGIKQAAVFCTDCSRFIRMSAILANRSLQ